MNIISDIEKYMYEPHEVKKVLDIHKKIIFQESQKKKFLFIKQHLTEN